MVREQIVVSVSSTGAVTVRKEIEGIGTSADKSAKGVDMLKGALASFVSGSTLALLARYSDTFTGIENKLKLVTNGSEELRAKQAELLGIANDTYTGYEALTALYQRTSQATDALGISSERVTAFVGNLAKTVTMSGSSAIEAENAIRQLTQGLASGELRGEEFRAVAEQLPMVLLVLQQALGKTAGQLRQMAYDGQLTPQIIIEAFEKVGPSIQANFGNYVPTIGQALTVLNNQIIAFVGWLNQTTGAANFAAQAILFLGNNLGLVLSILSPLGVAIVVLAVNTIGTLLVGAVTQASLVIGSLITTMGRLLLLVAANPFTALIAGLVLVIAYFIDWQKQIQQVIKVFGQLMTILGDLVGSEGLTSKGIQITLDAEALAKTLTEKSVEMKTKIEEGGKIAAAAMKSGVAAGGQQAAGAIRGAAAAGAASAAASAQATYQALNGVPQKIKGAITEGGDYIKNEVTGEITKAGNGMKTGIEDGGNSAAAALENGVKAGAQAGGRILYENIEQAFANNVRWLNDLYKIITARENAANREKNANAEKLSAEAEKLRAEASKLRLRFGQGDGGMSGGGGSGMGSGEGANTYLYRPPWREGGTGFLGRSDTSGSSEEGSSTTYGKVAITNVFDPNMLVEAQTSASGQKATVNNIKANRDEIRLALGIA